jgi:pimeloyl-ACP methyl ester carboxylesterase
MPRTVLTFTTIALLSYIGLCFYVFAIQRSLIYFPQSRSFSGDTATVTLPVNGAELLISTRPHSGPHALIYFGGNAEDVSCNLPSFSAAFLNHAIYLLHYRGYGGSSGEPSEAALFADALALFDKLRSEHQNIVVVGRSLGSGVAVYLASQRPVARLVLVTPYDSLQDLAKQQFPYLPVGWLLLDKFESWKYASKVNAPTLIIAAEHDEVIPRTSTDALYSRFHSEVVDLKVVAGTNHNTISESSEYIALLQGTQ